MTYLQGFIIGIVLLVLGAVGQLKLPKCSAGQPLSFLAFVVGFGLTLVSGLRLAGKYAVPITFLLAGLGLCLAVAGLRKAGKELAR